MSQFPENVFAVILAGGSGARFWPLSRESHPKQMLQIEGDDSLLRETIKRIEGFIPPENIRIVTTESMAQDIRFHLRPLKEAGEKIEFIKEPSGKNTAPAIGLAAISLHHACPESIMIVLPSDHAIPDPDQFREDLRSALKGAAENRLVVFGIRPDRPETGYGYIQFEDPKDLKPGGLVKVERFVEKPDVQTARRYVSSGKYYWNSGIFVWKASAILSEIETYLPSLYKTLKKTAPLLFTENPSIPQSAIRYPQWSTLYSALEPVSIDHGIMERSAKVWMVPATFRWSDLGSWTALDEINQKDENGNILKGNTVDIGSRNSIVFSGERLVATIGLNEMVVVDTQDATLITRKDKVQEVKKIVETLKRSGREEYLLHKAVERPWGRYTVLEKGNGYKIKRVDIQPGAKLSLQLHRRRSEHWIVVSGTAKVTKEDETYQVHTNESTFIPINTKHRLENPGEILLQIIEVQNGDYLEEDDIERFGDDFGR